MTEKNPIAGPLLLIALLLSLPLSMLLCVALGLVLPLSGLDRLAVTVICQPLVWVLVLWWIARDIRSTRVWLTQALLALGAAIFIFLGS